MIFLTHGSIIHSKLLQQLCPAFCWIESITVFECIIVSNTIKDSMEKTITIPWCNIWREIAIQLWIIGKVKKELQRPIAILKINNTIQYNKLKVITLLFKVSLHFQIRWVIIPYHKNGEQYPMRTYLTVWPTLLVIIFFLAQSLPWIEETEKQSPGWSCPLSLGHNSSAKCSSINE